MVLVSIICNCYNHGEYISKALEGFVKQKTNFEFEILIHDDASTDCCPDIIKQYESKYPNLIKPILQKENQYSKDVPITYAIQMSRAKGKYLAFCEGDDYWIDPYKLQKQVDYLEKHPECGMVYTDYIRYNQAIKKYKRKTTSHSIDSTEELLKGDCIGMLTTCYRADLAHRYYEEIHPQNRDWKMGDYPMWLWFSINSKLYYIPDVTAVYRELPNSASHNVNPVKQYEFEKSTHDIVEYFADQINANLPKWDDDYELMRFHFLSLLKQYDKKHAQTARKYYKKVKNKSYVWRAFFILSYCSGFMKVASDVNEFFRYTNKPKLNINEYVNMN